MPVIQSRWNASGSEAKSNREGLMALLAELDEAQAQARAGGGARYQERHLARGRLLPRERIELLLDPDTPFLELSTVAGWGTEYVCGGSVVTGIGLVEATECVVLAHDPTVRGGAMNPYTLTKVLRAQEIAAENALPFVSLVESAGADLPRQAEIFIPGGALFRNLTQLSAAGIPTITLVFGNATAGGAYMPGLSDYVVMVDEQARVFLGGPPLVKMATGVEADAERLGGAEMHSRVSGVSDYLARDERDAIRLGRQIIRRLNRHRAGPYPDPNAAEPLHPEEDLLGMAAVDLKQHVDAREIIARVVDGSEFDEFKPLYGVNLVTGWAEVHGYPVGILANDRGVLFSEESEKAAQFIQLANQISTPLVFVQNTTGYMVGEAYEQGGIVKDGSKMINAVSNSTVPHVTLVVGSAYGAGNYGMCGRAFQPRFLFSWPNSKSAVMGPQQLAGVMDIVARESASATGRPIDEAALERSRAAVEEQIERESRSFANSSRVYDDGVIDPRDTRTVLTMALSACHNVPIESTRRFGVFRM